MFRGDGPVVGVGGRDAVGVRLGWVLSVGNLRMSPCSSHSYCSFDGPPVSVIMRMSLVVSDTHDPLGRGVVRMSSGVDGGLCLFAPPASRSRTSYQHSGMPL